MGRLRNREISSTIYRLGILSIEMRHFWFKIKLNKVRPIALPNSFVPIPFHCLAGWPYIGVAVRCFLRKFTIDD